jgi:hypothetical protein
LPLAVHTSFLLATAPRLWAVRWRILGASKNGCEYRGSKPHKIPDNVRLTAHTKKLRRPLRAAVIEQIKATQETLSKLLVLLELSEADKFIAHLYQARKHYRLICERPNKGNKATEREIIANFQIAQNLGFKGHYHTWEHLLRTHE